MSDRVRKEIGDELYSQLTEEQRDFMDKTMGIINTVHDSKVIDKTKAPRYNVVPFAGNHNHISPLDLDNLLEDLQDMGYLSETGEEFRHAFWELFVKENHDQG